MERTRTRGEIPVLGFGTFELESDVARRMVESALESGYRHVDTARAYGNEREVGAAVRASGLPRDEVFLTTKVWPDDFGRVAEALEESLESLGMDHVDLLLLHWPSFRAAPLEEALEGLAVAREAGGTRHVGVSNFTVRLLREASARSPVPLAVNQVEYHPYLDQRPVLEAVREAEMALTAYSPLAQGRVVDDPVLTGVAERHGKSAAQVALRWLIRQDGVNAIPRTSDPAHCEANLRMFDFELDEEEVERIDRLAEEAARLIDPPELAPAWDT